MTDISRHPLLQKAYDVCQAIEMCGASVQLTNAVTKASELLCDLDAFIPTLPAGAELLAPHQQRVVEEKAQLDDKFEKLTTFQSTEIHAKLSCSEQHRLSIQWNAMKTYSRILGERIAAFGGGV